MPIYDYKCSNCGQELEIIQKFSDKPKTLCPNCGEESLTKQISALSGATVVFINQIRMKIGVMFGSPETTTGGNALKFYSSVRLDIRRIGAVKEGDEIMGNETRVKVVKNKVSPPFKQAEFQIMYGQGINSEGEILDYGHKLGLIEKSGAFYKMNGETIGQGKVKASMFLKENAKIRESLLMEIREAFIASKAKSTK